MAIEVEVEKLVYGGFGLARHQGKVFLIPYTAPGDRVLVEAVKEKGTFTIARIEKLVKGSTQRREPPCPYYEACGGCQLQHLDYQAQLDAKVSILQESLRRIGKLTWVPDIQVITGEEFHYRLRTQFKIQVEPNQIQIGYYRPESHEVCEISSCSLLETGINQALEQFRTVTGNSFEGVKQIDVIQGGDGAIGSNPDFNLQGSDNIERAVNGLLFRLNATIFFQVNRFLLEPMQKIVTDQEQGKSALDLYSGVGYFTLPLSRTFDTVVGIESSEQSVQLARFNASLNGCSNITFIMNTVEQWLALSSQSKAEFEVVIVDPPRAGLTRASIAKLLRLRNRRLIYVSCNPTTLARDLKHLLAGGYKLSTITALDLFPQTFHIETVVKLDWH